MVKANKVQLTSKIKAQSPISLATIAFYGVAGIVFLILLPFSGFPPHVALLGIVSVIAAYGLLFQRKWTIWLVIALFFVATVFSLYTIYFTIGTDIINAAGLIVYAVLTWVFTLIIVKKPREL